MSIKEKIEQFLDTLLEGSEHFLVEIEQKGTERFPKLFIFLDGDKGISINDCSKISKTVNQFIEEKELITTEYAIDVSSPGIDRELLKKRQYISNISRMVRVWLSDSSEIEGRLMEVNEESITIEIKKKKVVESVKIDFAQIEKTKVLITF